MVFIWDGDACVYGNLFLFLSKSFIRLAADSVKTMAACGVTRFRERSEVFGDNVVAVLNICSTSILVVKYLLCAPPGCSAHVQLLQGLCG